MKYKIDPDIRKAFTLNSEIYSDEPFHSVLIDEAFSPSWQFLGSMDIFNSGHNLIPIKFLNGSIEEPMLISKLQDKEILCSNVCTHRAMILLEEPTTSRLISCKYHGRCFRCDGSFKSMPEFETALNFPTEADNLKQFPLEKLGNLLFGSLNPSINFSNYVDPFLSFMDWFDFSGLIHDPSCDKVYEIDSNWMLYCENYLEGFHVPFVHEKLNDQIIYEDYETRLFERSILQIGHTKEASNCFPLEKTKHISDQAIYALYWFIFPNMMLNFYPWGLSINVVEPLGHQKTRIKFMTYFVGIQNRDAFQSSALDETELEDEAVVLGVQKGVNSKAYMRGRFSPTREIGVHHFQSIISQLS